MWFTLDHTKHSPCASVAKLERDLGFKPAWSSLEAVRATAVAANAGISDLPMFRLSHPHGNKKWVREGFLISLAYLPVRCTPVGRACGSATEIDLIATRESNGSDVIGVLGRGRGDVAGGVGRPGDVLVPGQGEGPRGRVAHTSSCVQGAA